MTRPADRLVDACRVPLAIPERRVGLWEIRRFFARDIDHPLASAFVRHSIGGYDHYTALMRDTLATLHQDRGEVVMEDTARELRRHLPALLAAHGRVLVSGLGLGCVLRGMLAKPEVEHIDVVEVDPSILTLCGAEFEGNPRVTLHLGDAESIWWPTGTRWDVAWHDVWSEDEALDVVHARLLVRYEPWCAVQGAWQFRRPFKRAWPRKLLGAARRAA